METRIPDFTDSELWTVRSTLTQRYGHAVPVELADAELRLEPEARQYGTGRETYDDLSPCAITLLQVQAEREKERNPAKPDTDTAAQEPTDSNTTPLFWGD